VHRTVRALWLKALTLHSAKRKIYSCTRQGSFLRTRALGTASPTRGTGHTHLISRFLFFHLSSSGFFARRCNHLCLPLSIHHLPISDVIRALLPSGPHYAPFILRALVASSAEREREREREGERRLETRKEQSLFSSDFLLNIVKWRAIMNDNVSWFFLNDAWYESFIKFVKMKVFRQLKYRNILHFPFILTLSNII